jgi:hypothetical protein
MTIKTLRDCEVELRKIVDRVDNLTGGRTGQGTTTTRTIVQQTELPSSLRTLLAELDIVEDGKLMVHQAYHRFDQDVDMKKAFVRDRVSNVESEMELVFNSATPDLSFYWQTDQILQIIGGATPLITPFYDLVADQDNVINIGSAVKAFKEAWINILNAVTLNADDLILADDLDVNGTTTLIGLTASLPLKLNASKEIISAAINLASSEITGVLAVGNGGTGLAGTGITGALTVNVTTNTINYKDHGGANASMVVVTGVTLTANAFTSGIRTT